MKLKVLSVVVFLTGLVLFINSWRGAQGSDQTRISEQKPFIVHYLASRSIDTSTPEPYEYRVKYVNSSGEWKETRYSFDSNVVTWVGAKDGMYLGSNDSLQYYGKHDPEMVKYPNASKEAITASPQFSRIEKVAGLEAYILKNSSPETETEAAFAIETGRIPLKLVSNFKRGDRQFIQVVEAMNVEFREISQEEFQLPDLPVRFDIAEHKVQSLKQAGQKEMAWQLEQAVNRLRAHIK